MSSNFLQRRGRLFMPCLFLLLACARLPAGHAQIIDTPNTLYRIAGGGNSFSKPDGVGPAAKFFRLTAIVNTNGRLWVVDQSLHSLRRIDPDGRVETVAGFEGKCGSHDGTGSSARFCSPRGLAVDAAGSLYIADFMNSTVRKYVDGLVVTVAGITDLCGRNDTPKGDSLCKPTALAFDGSNNLYVADAASVLYRINVLTRETTVIAGQHKCADAHGNGRDAGFCVPQGIAINRATGDVYVADTENHAIRKVTPEGTMTTFAGKAKDCGYADGKGSARLCVPHGIAIDSAGNLYVVDKGNSTIRKITPDGQVSTVAGRPGFGPTKLGPLPGAINIPVGIAVIDENRLAVITEHGEVLGINF